MSPREEEEEEEEEGSEAERFIVVFAFLLLNMSCISSSSFIKKDVSKFKAFPSLGSLALSRRFILSCISIVDGDDSVDHGAAPPVPSPSTLSLFAGGGGAIMLIGAARGCEGARQEEEEEE